MCCNGLLSQIPRLGDIEVRMVESLHAVTKVGGWATSSDHLLTTSDPYE